MVCPGRDTAWPATGRSGVERNCRAHERPCMARAARSGRHRGQQAVRHSLAFSRHAYRAATGPAIRRISALMPERDCCLRNPGTAGQSGVAGTRNPVLEVAVRSAHLPSFPDHCLHQHSPLTTVSRLLTSGRAQRQALSTPSPGEPTWGRLAGTYPYNSKQSNPASCGATRLQLRCNPGSHRNVRTRLGIPPNPLRVHIVARVLRVCHRHCCRWRRFFGTPFFSIEFAFRRGRWRRPCVKYRFNSYTCRGLTAACRLYIQNEGLRENFWEDRANDLAKRCCSPFITDR